MRNLVAPVLRLVQFLLLLIATALIGNVRATTIDAAGTATAAINFAIFACALAWIAVIYSLITQLVSIREMPLVSLAMDGTATLFTFIAAIVLSAKLTTVNCGNAGNKPADWIAFGSGNTQKRCREIQAGLVFLWFLFGTFAAALALAFREFRRSGTIRGPSMSQIGV